MNRNMEWIEIYEIVYYVFFIVVQICIGLFFVHIGYEQFKLWWFYTSTIIALSTL